MRGTEFAEMAARLSSEGDHFAASILCFVGSLHCLQQTEALREIAEFAGNTARRAQSKETDADDWPSLIDEQ